MEPRPPVIKKHPRMTPAIYYECLEAVAMIELGLIDRKVTRETGELADRVFEIAQELLNDRKLGWDHRKMIRHLVRTGMVVGPLSRKAGDPEEEVTVEEVEVPQMEQEWGEWAPHPQIEIISHGRPGYLERRAGRRAGRRAERKAERRAERVAGESTGW